MTGLSRIASLLAGLLSLAIVALPRPALAQSRAQSLHVLAIDSDDADEQADAFTNALRSRVRQTSGWTLLETSQSLSMLTAAFQCPQHPDAACLDRIGDKLKTDQYLWGVLAKAPNHQVTAEVHLWSKGKPDKSTRETFSDNLKDANDDSLRKIASQVFAKLLGLAGGTLAIHASADSGTVLVDGTAKTTLDHGRATVALAAGPHAIEVQAPGFAPARREVTIEPSSNGQLELVLESTAVAVVAPPSKPLPYRTIGGVSAIVAGGILVGVGAGFGIDFLSQKSDLNDQRQKNYLTGSSIPVTSPCNVQPSFQSIPNIEYGCRDVNAAHSDVVGEVTTFAIGGALVVAGIVVLATDHHDTPASSGAAATLHSLHFRPSVGTNGGSMVVVGQF